MAVWQFGGSGCNVWLSGTNLPAMLKVECHGMKRADNILAFFFPLLSFFLSYFSPSYSGLQFSGEHKRKRKKVKKVRDQKRKSA